MLSHFPFAAWGHLLLKPLTFRSMSIGGVTFPLEQKSKDPQAVAYSAVYDTEGVARTKSGERQPVQVTIHVRVSSVTY